MIAQYLWIAGSVIISLMGTSHLRATLGTTKLHPGDEQLIKDMQSSSLRISDELNTWKSWIGFNATHSAGTMFIGIINFYLALQQPDLLKSSWFLLLLTVVTTAFYVWVAVRYWMKAVKILLMIVFACYAVAAILILCNNAC
ncbi:LIC_13387 family protein [Chitinophaga qingshengii]|uniref:Uncharacterized protein n=1 Tax=Chitinophaga qingshengii TaxID=1569794 RepID=A0ABR7TL80_9BACT|nr:hypothetical protein [Chitinophaga qingshengii]MBC9929814.1 hypothetical protein [Chitinophaga qingshengii]